MAKAIVIIGANSFLGRALANHLANGPYEIALVGRGVQADCADGLRHHSVDDYHSAVRFMSRGSVVINCIGASSHSCDIDESLAFKINSDLPLYLYSQASLIGCECFIHFSTVHVYGNMVSDIHEWSQPNPISNYARSKFAGERQLYRLKEVSSSECRLVILRLANVFGFNSDLMHASWKTAISSFCYTSYMDREIRVLSREYVERDFVPVAVFCRVVIEVTKSKIAGTFNLATGRGQSLLEAAERVALVYKRLFVRTVKIYCNSISPHCHKRLRISSSLAEIHAFDFDLYQESEIERIFNGLYLSEN